MILHPAIIALISGSILITIISVYSSIIGFQILKWWDIKSGSERQLNLERKTYLISTVLTSVLVFEILSLFLFIYTAESLHPLFTGSMCAVGTLSVNQYGYPSLIIKTANAVLCGLWLIMNYTDNRGFDYPLIKKKYAFLLFIVTFIIIEAIVQLNYFLRLRGDVITSCCGALFSTDRQNIVSDLTVLPAGLSMKTFYLTAAVTLGSEIYFFVKKKGSYFLALSSVVFLIISIVSIISFIGPYYYELPTHHCPFCILQRECYFMGYPIYFFLFSGNVLGIGAGMINLYKNHVSLQEIIPSIQIKLTRTSFVFNLIFLILSTYPVLFSNFKLYGY